jgi:hypothetical protein
MSCRVVICSEPSISRFDVAEHTTVAKDDESRVNRTQAGGL